MALIRMMLKVKDLKDNKQQQVSVGVAGLMGKMMDWRQQQLQHNNNKKNTKNNNNNNTKYNNNKHL